MVRFRVEEDAFAEGAPKKKIVVGLPRCQLGLSQHEQVSGIIGYATQEVRVSLLRGLVRMRQHDQQVEVAAGAVVSAGKGPEENDFQHLRMLPGDPERFAGQLSGSHACRGQSPLRFVTRAFCSKYCPKTTLMYMLFMRRPLGCARPHRCGNAFRLGKLG